MTTESTMNAEAADFVEACQTGLYPPRFGVGESAESGQPYVVFPESHVNWDPGPRSILTALQTVEDQRARERILTDAVEGRRKLDWSRLNFREGHFVGFHFNGHDLTGASFANTRMAECSFESMHLTSAKFTDATLWRCQFGGEANIQLCDFTGTMLYQTAFWADTADGADFAGANLDSSVLFGLNLERVFGLDKTDGVPLVGGTSLLTATPHLRQRWHLARPAQR